jgi:hypothetical protein
MSFSADHARSSATCESGSDTQNQSINIQSIIQSINAQRYASNHTTDRLRRPRSAPTPSSRVARTSLAPPVERKTKVIYTLVNANANSTCQLELNVCCECNRVKHIRKKSVQRCFASSDSPPHFKFEFERIVEQVQHVTDVLRRRRQQRATCATLCTLETLFWRSTLTVVIRVQCCRTKNTYSTTGEASFDANRDVTKTKTKQTNKKQNVHIPATQNKPRHTTVTTRRVFACGQHADIRFSIVST